MCLKSMYFQVVELYLLTYSSFDLTPSEDTIWSSDPSSMVGGLEHEIRLKEGKYKIKD